MNELVRGDRIYLTDENGAEGLYVIVNVVKPPVGNVGDMTYALMPLDGGTIRSVGRDEWRERSQGGRGRVWLPPSVPES